MVPGANPEISRAKDGRGWGIGGEATVAWIQDGTEGGVAITSVVPPVFEAYATIVLPLGDEAQDPEDAERQDPAMLAVLTEHTTPQPWWLGYLETGAYLIPFSDAPKVTLMRVGATCWLRPGLTRPLLGARSRIGRARCQT